MTILENRTEATSHPAECSTLCLRSIAAAVRDIRNEDHNEALRALLEVTGGRALGAITCRAAGCSHTEEFFSHHLVIDPQ